MGALTPLTVAETPTRLMGSGSAPALAVAVDNCVPNTVISVPGANAWAYDAPLATAVIAVVCDAPTTKATGTLMACGMPSPDCTVTVPVYAPRERPAAFTVMWRGAEPVPEGGVT